MGTGKSRLIYLNAMCEQPSLGIANGLRPELTLDEARSELSEAINRVATHALNDRYGLLLGAIPQPLINEFLKGVEFNISLVKDNLTVVFQELLDRVTSKKQKVDG